MNILAIQNFQLTPPGILGECVEARGGFLYIWKPSQDGSLPYKSSNFSGLIILGGPMHAEDDANHPQLRDMVNLIHQFHSENKPILGVCLGAQVLVRAFGQRVYKHDIFELGFVPVFLSKTSTMEDPLFRGCPDELHLMQWHFDTFDLPKEATLLMYGKQCRNQAYRIGSNIYGFQFHLEVTREILQSWIDTRNEFIKNNYPNFSEELTQQMERHIENSIAFCRQVGNAWLDLVEARILNEPNS